MSTYTGTHAELYDLLYADKPYDTEASFVASALRAHFPPDRPARRILDVACGTASHALALHALGFEVFGVDASEAMLTVARRKIGATGSPIRVERQDMRDLRLGREHGFPFDAAVCLFDSIGHVIDNDGVEATLAGMCAHISPGGIIALEFWHAPSFVAGFERCRVRRLIVPGGQVLRISETDVDLTNQIATVRYEFHELRTDGSFASSNETVQVRFFGVAEMAALLVRAGLEPLAFHDGYSSSTSIKPGSVHIVTVARKR